MHHSVRSHAGPSLSNTELQILQAKKRISKPRNSLRKSKKPAGREQNAGGEHAQLDGTQSSREPFFWDQGGNKSPVDLEQLASLAAFYVLRQCQANSKASFQWDSQICFFHCAGSKAQSHSFLTSRADA